MKKLVLFFVFLVVLGIVGLAFDIGSFLYLKKSSKDIIYEIEPGFSFGRVASDLAQEGVVSDARYFRYFGRILGKTDKIRVGEYDIPAGLSPFDVLTIIVTGKSREYDITIQEGLNMFEIASVVEKSGVATRDNFLNVCKDKNLIRELLGHNYESFEGYLFPETYRVTKYTSAKDLVRKMVSKYLEVYSDLQGKYLKKFNRHELTILASIVEKETGSPEDRGKISSVFHNRLKKNMRLQSDPTILYGILDSTGVWKNNITKKDIKGYTRYNTYRVNRLPHGPISNPGRAALESTLNPEKTDYLYFVSRNDGTTQFSKTYKEHQRAVYKFQINKKNRQGKSWRDLQGKNN